MRFQVPQFIEIEDKIFGPLTLKQFIYLAGGGGIIFIVYVLTDSIFLTFLFSAPFAALSFALAFYEINNRPFSVMLEAATNYFLNSRFYTWSKSEQKPQRSPQKDPQAQTNDQIFVPRMSHSKLSDLASKLDTHSDTKN